MIIGEIDQQFLKFDHFTAILWCLCLNVVENLIRENLYDLRILKKVLRVSLQQCDTGCLLNRFLTDDIRRYIQVRNTHALFTHVSVIFHS